MGLKENIQEIQSRIEKAAARSGRQATDITLVAVSKTVDLDKVRMAYELGLRNFGENRVQELQQKMAGLPEASWHMIGRLQSNKIKDVVGQVKLIHSLDRWKLAEDLEKRGQQAGLEVPVLIEVNISGEKQKAGFPASEVKALLESAGQFKSLRIYGFMTMAPLTGQAELSRPIFRELSDMKQQLSKKSYTNVELKHLSMGMSDDFEVAIEEGASIVRIGTALFRIKDRVEG
ncbi:MAG: YggS family pyridoxal phosphate-dependent enzyme [Syntrophomonadaceae bacterium]|nr:YggS family pyridoxal phosphate-dependent enzyme [Syntrophomonadaceae bacterium]